MITKSVYHRDFHTYQRHCYRTWGVQNLDLYSQKNQNCSHDMHWMNHWNHSCVMKSLRLLHIHLLMQSLYPIRKFSIQRDTRQDKRQEEWRALATNQHIKRAVLYWGERRNQKLNSPTQQLKKSENQLNERLVSHLGVSKDERRLKNKLIFFCCFASSWVTPPFSLILARILVIGYELGDKNGI